MEIEAIILNVVPYKDNDAIVNALTREGMITFSARGIMQMKSKNASLIMLYNHVILHLNDKDDGKSRFLKSGNVIKSATSLYETIDGMLTLSFIGELTYKSVDEEAASFLFDLFIEAINAMHTTKNFPIIQVSFLANIIKKLGIGLQLDECIKCGARTKIVSVSYEKGGYICKKCFSVSDNNQSEAYLKLARYIFKTTLFDISKTEFAKEDILCLLNDLVNHLDNELSIRIKSFKLINTIAK